MSLKFKNLTQCSSLIALCAVRGKYAHMIHVSVVPDIASCSCRKTDCTVQMPLHGSGIAISQRGAHSEFSRIITFPKWT